MPRAIVIRENPARTPEGSEPINIAAVEDFPESGLSDDPVTIDVSYSSLNYKDGLALSGRPGVVRSTPLVGGIDLVGTVRESSDPRWQAGDKVILNGTGMSETRHGGLSEVAKVPGDFLVRLPDGFSMAHAAALGTAGYTAALCVLRLQRAGVESSSELPILVTGATGGVGSVAIMLLAGSGHHVAALTGRVDQFGDYLTGLGAEQIVHRAELSERSKPLQKQRWAGGVDTVGGDILANALAQTNYGGTVAACGLAGSPKLPATVMPFILRSVTLAGVDSVQSPMAERQAAWDLLADQLPLDTLDQITTTVSLGEAISAAQGILDGASHGRIAVDVRS